MRDQAAVHGVQIHVGNHFKEQSEETRGTFCLSAFWLEFIWKGLIGGSAFVNLNTSNTGESRALIVLCVHDSIQAFTSQRGVFLIYRFNTLR